jgi:hypothetical protein
MQREQKLKEEDDVVISIEKILMKKANPQQKPAQTDLPPLILPSKVDYINSVDHLLLDSLSSVDRPHRCSAETPPTQFADGTSLPCTRPRDQVARQSPLKPCASPTSPTQTPKERPLIADLISHFSETLKCLKKKKEVQVISTHDADFLRHSSPAKSILTVDRSRSPFSTRAKLITIEPRDSCGLKHFGKPDCSPQSKKTPVSPATGEKKGACLDHRIRMIKAPGGVDLPPSYIKGSYHIGKSNVTTSTGTLKNIPSKSNHADCSVSKTPSESTDGRPSAHPLNCPDSPGKKRAPSKYWKAESLKNLQAQSKQFSITPKMRQIITSAEVSSIASKYLHEKSPASPSKLRQSTGPGLSVRGAFENTQTFSRVSLENSLNFASQPLAAETQLALR